MPRVEKDFSASRALWALEIPLSTGTTAPSTTDSLSCSQLFSIAEDVLALLTVQSSQLLFSFLQFLFAARRLVCVLGVDLWSFRLWVKHL